LFAHLALVIGKTGDWKNLNQMILEWVRYWSVQ